jgi:phosphatidylserine decarboxylase
VLERRAKVLSINERCVLRLDTPQFPLFLVMVGALNVGRIKVVGVESSARLTPPRPMTVGDELARFEMGSTVVLVAPAHGPRPSSSLGSGDAVRMGSEIGRVEQRPAK